MKKIHEMDHAEIVALTEADLRRLLHVAMAEMGIPVLEEPVPPPTAAIPAEDTLAFTAKCLGELAFTDREEALRVLDLIRGCRTVVRVYEDYAIKGKRVYSGYANEYDRGDDAYDLRSVSGRSGAQVQALHEQLEARNKSEADFKALAEAYKKAHTAAKRIREEIYGTYEEHHAQDRRREALRGKFQQYLDLAEGSAEVALRFLGKVEELTADDQAMLLGMSARKEDNS